MNLYIVGNGFDLAHGLPCSYSDFKKYLESDKKWKNVLSYLDDLYDDALLWSDFERALGGPNIKMLSTIKNIFQKDISGNLVKSIKEAFRSWIGHLEGKIKNRKFELSKEDLYFSFNYTSTLNTLYKIPL